MTSELSAVSLYKIYHGRTVVDGVSLHLSPGEIVGLLGPNGAGKTTTFYMVSGMIRPTRGRIVLGGKDVTGWPMHLRARAGLGYLPQEPSIFRGMTVDDNLLAIMEVARVPRPAQAGLLEELKESVGVGSLGGALASSLSGGERRRVEIARALITRPSFLLLDEPFAGIDPITVAGLQKLIRGLRDRAIGVLITDHNVRETLGITDRAYILAGGSVLEEGSPTAIAASDRARKIYLGEAFSL